MRALRLNGELYSQNAIEQAVDAYRTLAEIEVSSKDGYRICVFRNCLLDECQTVCEFENYLIDLMNCA